MQFFFERGERGEKIYSLITEEGQKQKKRNSPISRTRNLPSPGILQKKMAFALQPPPRDKKEAAPRRRPPRLRRCARVSFARRFSDRIRFFFSLAQNCFVFQREEKKRDQKTNQKSATLHRRVSAHSPQNRPFDAVKRAHRTPKCTGSTSVRALTPSIRRAPVARRTFLPGVCVFENKSRKRSAGFSYRRRIIAQKPTSLDDGKKGERFCLVRF